MARGASAVAKKPTQQHKPARALFLTVAIVAACSLVAALVMAGMWWNERDKAAELRAERATDSELRTEYANFAEDVMTQLMTIRQDTLSEDVEKIIGNIEGDFGEQFAPRKDSYKEVVETTGVVADGVVVAKAVEAVYPDHAEVIMAIDQTIANESEKESQDRQYRIRVTVNRHTDGEMKVSGVNFIP